MQHDVRFGRVVAAFPNRACADEAARDLHRVGVRHVSCGEVARRRVGELAVGAEESQRIAAAVAGGRCLVLAEDVPDDVDARAIAVHHGGKALATTAPGDPLDATRIEAAHRHPVSGELDINDLHRTARRFTAD